MADISNIVKSLQNIMWKDPGVSGDAQRIEQLGWMITLKILDDKDAEMELVDEDFKVKRYEGKITITYKADEVFRNFDNGK